MDTYLRGINTQLIDSLLFWNCWAIVFGFFLFIFLQNQKKIAGSLYMPRNLFLFILVVAYFVSVIAITIVPLPYSELFKTAKVNLIPFKNTYENLVSPEKRQSKLLASDVLANIIGNILMFLPFGMIIPFIFKNVNRWWKMALIAAIGSSMIELVQYLSRYFHNYRQVDIDDVILNISGALIGYCLHHMALIARQRSSNSQED